MRVLHVYAGNLYGGIETMLVAFARYQPNFPDLRHEYALCFPGRLRDELLAAGAAVHDLGAVRFSRPWTTWQARRRLRALLRGEVYDAVICHSSWPHVLAAPVVRAAGRPLIYWAHGTTDISTTIETWAAQYRPSAVIANSRYTGESVARLFPDCPAHIVYCPVLFGPPLSSEDRLDARRTFGLKPGDVWIVMVSRLEPLKGHLALLKALSKMLDLPSWKCGIAGGAQRSSEHAYLESLRSQSAQLGLGARVEFLGQRSDIPQVLAAADLYCQPNAEPEGFGISIIEALHAGLPVVTTGFGGAAEIVDQSCGTLVPPGDADCLQAALRNLVLDGEHRRKVGHGGPVRALKMSSPSQANQSLVGIIDGLCTRDTVLGGVSASASM